MPVTLLCTIFYVYIWTCLSEINLYIYIDISPDGFLEDLLSYITHNKMHHNIYIYIYIYICD